MCGRRKNRTTTVAYNNNNNGHSLPNTDANIHAQQQLQHDYALHQPQVVSHGRCSHRRRQTRCHGGLFALLSRKIREHQAEVGTERSMIAQNEVETKGEGAVEIGNSDGDGYWQDEKLDTSTPVDVRPPSYEAVMKSG